MSCSRRQSFCMYSIWRSHLYLATYTCGYKNPLFHFRLILHPILTPGETQLMKFLRRLNLVLLRQRVLPEGQTNLLAAILPRYEGIVFKLESNFSRCAASSKLNQQDHRLEPFFLLCLVYCEASIFRLLY